MTDLEITKLCAEAMGYEYFLMPHHLLNDHAVYLGGHEGDLIHYDPLHDDAQAMALVRRFKMLVGFNVRWNEYGAQMEAPDMVTVHKTDLNRAICECVAKMQKANL